jgi:hypothetical protein
MEAGARQDGRRGRRVAAWVLLVLATLALAVGELTLYAREAVFDSASFSARATSTLDDAEVREVIARRATDQLVRAEPDLVGARPIIEATTDGVVRARAFQSLFEKAVRDLHRSVFTRDRDTATFTIADVGVLVSEGLRQVSPQVAERIPESVKTSLLNVSEGGLGTDLAQVAEEARFLSILGPLLALVLFAASVAVAVNRRDAIRRVGIALAAVGIGFVVVYSVGRSLVMAQFEGDGRTVASVVWEAFLRDFRTWNLILAVAGVVLAAAAAALLRPVDVGRPLRRAWDAVARTPERPVPRAARALGFVALGIAIIAERETLLTLALVLLGAYVLYLGVAELLRMSLPAEPERTAPARSRRPGRPVAAAAVAALAAVAIVGLFAVAALGGGEEEEPPVAITECNGFARLCDRPLNEIAFATTHNAMSAPDYPGYLFAQQDARMVRQLDAGVRALAFDTHYGRQAGSRVATSLDPDVSRGELLAEGVSPAAIDAALRLRARILGREQGPRRTWLCHGFCEVGAVGFTAELKEIRDWVVAHPTDVLVFIIEDDITPQDTETAFRESGLLDFVYTGRWGPPWPTLRALIEADQRVVVMGENDPKGVDWYHPAYDVTQETPFHFTSAAQLEAGASCEPNRGGTDKPFFLVNHWVDSSPYPRPSNARGVNAYDFLSERVERCRRERRAFPNFVSIDFYREGDVFRLVDELNGVRPG